MPTDVSQAGRAEQCVGDGVQQRIRIRMAQQPDRMGNGHPPQHQRTARDQGVRVPALADPQGAQVHADTLEPLP
jgi:hypothetical protein